MHRAMILALSLVVAGAAQAAPSVESAYSATYNHCMETGNAARGVTPAMAACIHAEHGRHDVKLNAAYKRAMARLSPAGRIKLRNDERAWIKRRDAHCAEEASSGGTIDRINWPMCMLDETIVRTRQLDRLH
jgi:uncharacterized protein YecT (DUF1311 family)